MLSFIVRRMMVTVVILFLLSLATFTLLRIMPGDDVICPSFCSKEEREARRIEAGLDKPWFPISVKDGTSAWWLLVVPAAGAGGYVLIRNVRRLRESAIADYALSRLPWNLAVMSLLVIPVLAAFEWESRREMLRVYFLGVPEAAAAFRRIEAQVADMGSWVHPFVPISQRMAHDGGWLLVMPAAALLTFAAASMMTRPRAITLPRAD